MNIRLATREDYAPVRALLMQIQAIHAAVLPKVFNPPHPQGITADRYQQVIAHPNKQIFVISVAAQVVAYIYAEVIQSRGDVFHRGRSWVYIHQLAVHPEHRHQGYAQALVQRVITFAQDRGVDRVEIEVWGFNQPARSLYEKLGFTLQSERLWLQLPHTASDSDPSDSPDSNTP